MVEARSQPQMPCFFPDFDVYKVIFVDQRAVKTRQRLSEDALGNGAIFGEFVGEIDVAGAVLGAEARLLPPLGAESRWSYAILHNLGPRWHRTIYFLRDTWSHNTSQSGDILYRRLGNSK
jgi:hypothetical protein